jgi:dTDP-4-dehydrorhamnose 3,5-epimerase
MPFEFKRLKIPDVVLIKPKVFEDERGFFMETFKLNDFEKFGIDFKPVQENHSKSKFAVLRGLHFQKKPYEQAKLFRCIKGKIFDVAVDIRKNSQTFGQHVSVILSAANKNILFVPKGFVHGFEVLSKEAEVVYLVDNVYMSEYDAGIRWNDEDLKIEWPIKEPILSEKDKNLPKLREVVL